MTERTSFPDPDFVVLADDQDEQPVPAAKAAPGNVVAFDETLFDPAAWPDRKPVGAAHGVFAVTPSNHATYTVTLDFGGGDTVTAVGVLELTEGTFEGTLTVTGGTGNGAGLIRLLHVGVENPKRYTGEP